MAELDGLRVLVTRPGDRGADLCRAIREAGGVAEYFPAMQIVAVTNTDALRTLAATFPQEPLTIFISVNAVTCGQDWLQARGLWRRVAAGRVAAVGSGTAAQLRAAGIGEALAPASGSGSAALLALPELQTLGGQEVVVFRGVGGKENLAQVLSERGVQVRYAEVYRRVPPAVALSGTLLERVDIVTTTSREALENLFASADREAGAHLRQLPLLVSSPAAAQSARAHGAQISPIISPQVSNRHIVEALARWQKNQSRTTRQKTAN